MNADLSKKLSTKINFSKNGKSVTSEVIYLWLPLRCHTCKKWGHVQKFCVLKKNDGIGMSEQFQKNMVLKSNEKEKKTTEEIAVSEYATSSSMGNNEDEMAVSKDVEIEGGQIVEGWPDATLGKTNSANRTLEFGRVKLLTPSRFLVLNEINDNGELIDQTEKTEEITQGKETEISGTLEDSRGGSGKTMEETYSEVVTTMEEVISETENKEEDNSSEAVANMEDIISEEGTIMEEIQKEAVVKSPTYCEIVRSDSWKEATRKSTNTDLVNVIRPSLPRTSKTYHKVFFENFVPGYPGRKATRKALQ